MDAPPGSPLAGMLGLAEEGPNPPLRALSSLDEQQEQEEVVELELNDEEFAAQEQVHRCAAGQPPVPAGRSDG